MASGPWPAATNARGRTGEGFATLGFAERALSVLACLWVLVIGIETEQVPTHVIEAFPLLLLAVAPRSTWVRATAIAAGFSWLYMLVAVTPEFHQAIVGWQFYALSSWLAPTMVALCVAWMAANLAILSKLRRPNWVYLAGCLGIVLPLWLLNRCCMEQLLYPLQRIVEGHYAWSLPLVGSSLAMVTCILLGVAWTTGAKLPLSRRTVGLSLAYWLLFVACMIVSQLPGIKHY